MPAAFDRNRCSVRSAFVMSLAAIALAGCGSKDSDSGASGALGAVGAKDYSVCANSPALPFAAGMSVVSASGAYRATLQSAATVQDGASVQTAGIGYDTFTLAITSAGDGGADVPPGLTVTATALPWMPIHMHGASTLPAVSALPSQTYTVADIDFFMGGYWQLPLNLVPTSGTADPVVFSICIPDD